MYLLSMGFICMKYLEFVDIPAISDDFAEVLELSWFWAIFFVFLGFIE